MALAASGAWSEAPAGAGLPGADVTGDGMTGPRLGDFVPDRRLPL
jgi:hypothetical protein